MNKLKLKKGLALHYYKLDIITSEEMLKMPNQNRIKLTNDTKIKYKPIINFHKYISNI